MQEKEGFKAYVRLVNDKHNALKSALTNFIQAFSAENKERKISTAQAVLEAVAVLKQHLSSEDRPTWISSLEREIHRYIQPTKNNERSRLQVFQIMIGLYPRIQSHIWNFDQSSENLAIDFSTIYRECFDSSRVASLFDELIQHLETIIDSGEIDSKKATYALERLIATIKKNSRGDFFSTRGVWEFSTAFLKNYGFEILESTPGVKQAVKALRKTMSELDVEFSEVHNEVKDRLEGITKTEFPMLQYNLLPPSEDKNL